LGLQKHITGLCTNYLTEQHKMTAKYTNNVQQYMPRVRSAESLSLMLNDVT